MRTPIAIVSICFLATCIGCGGGGGNYSAPRAPSQADLERISAKGSTGGNSFNDEEPPPAPKPSPKTEQTKADETAKSGDAQSPATGDVKQDSKSPDEPAAVNPAGGNNADASQTNAFDDDVFGTPPDAEAKSAPAVSAAPSPATNQDAASEGSGRSGAFNDEMGVNTAPPPTSRAASPGAARGGGKNARMLAGGGDSSSEPSADDSADAQMNPGTKSGVIAAPKSLIDRAVQSYKLYNESAASQLLYGHWLTLSNATTEYPLQWVSGLSEPRIFFRWGIGVVYEAPSSFSRQPPLIGGAETVALDDQGGAGRPQNTPLSGMRVGRGARLGAPTQRNTEEDQPSAPYEGLDMQLPIGDFIFHTGDFGERLLKRLESRRLHKDGYYGKILANSEFGRWEYHRGSRTTGEAAPPPTTQRGSAGGFGGGFDEAPAGVVQSDPNAPKPESVEGTLVPGVIYLGVETDSSDEQALLEKAKSLGLDGAFIFYVDVKLKTRAKELYSSTSLGVHNLKTGESNKTGSLNSETVAKAREKNRNEDDDPVELALDKVFKNYSDEKLRLSAMPELKPDIAKKRVDSLVAEKHANPLQAASEVISYHRAGLLEEMATVDAVGKLLGDPDAAQKLVSGSEDDKIAAVEKWMPQDLQSAAGDSSFR